MKFRLPTFSDRQPIFYKKFGFVKLPKINNDFLLIHTNLLHITQNFDILCKSCTNGIEKNIKVCYNKT